MGTVHSFAREATAPERLRRRFDSAFTALDRGQEGGPQSLPPILVSGGNFFEAPWEAAGRLADDALRQSTLFWLSFSRQQLRFFCLIP